MDATVTPMAAANKRRDGKPSKLRREVIDDMVAANRMLAALNVLDAFGHVSMRDPRNPDHYLISVSKAPESVTAADIVALDLDSDFVEAKDRERLAYRERFLHGEIYKARPDVQSIVHSHSPTVIPFTVTKAPLRPVLQNAGFLGLGTPNFDIRKRFGDSTDLQIINPEQAQALAKTLGKTAAVVLMRGHGLTVVGPTLRDAVFRCYYTEVNARLQLQAIGIGGPITFLSKGEAAASSQSMLRAYARPWALWRAKVLAREPLG